MLWFDRAGLDGSLYDSLAAEYGPRRPRVLSWARTSEGVVVALPERLAIHQDDAWRSIRWLDILKGTWDRESGELAWSERDEDEGGVLSLTEPRDIPEVFRDRIQASIVTAKRVDLPTGGSVLISARREPSQKQGPLLWELAPTPDADVENEQNATVIADTYAWMKGEYDI